MQKIRNIQPADYQTIHSVMDAWWGGRQMSDMLPKLFFIHFTDTSFIMEENGEIQGFLCGFMSQLYPEEAYVHFIGVDPNARRGQVGKQLYEQFFKTVQAKGATVVRAVTSPINTASIAFHTRIGFEVEKGDATDNGVSVFTDYDGKGQSRVLFKKAVT
ncbi:GNAT family N-acetyltransferase [Paenalkalicoccus suaedae]|uniref:GNAT family N-acetyltransferase n=1 Tax=Paenalkalicoccus suaedae TaxID=2592382 RepID=A0A859FIY3_9BACI|nr:GNAT family N-acetyltransferase [Paenalkalicoccus suaedae]QKS72702.1 GNAT family N-acetyltransferase [Paenalkalicoccus suaedae]